MIELKQGDILNSEVEALVNTVNCVGIMGRGIALQFRKAFPENYKAYKTLCDHKGLHPGAMFVFDLNTLINPRYIINFPTKRHWKGKSRMGDIESGLTALIEEITKLGITSIALPPLGCGLGGLDWKEVRPRIERAFEVLPEVRVLLYEPAGAPEVEKMAKPKTAPNMTPGRAALLGLMNRYLSGLMDPFVSLLEIHKLMYFMQVSGEGLKLNFIKGPYGPYAVNLRHVLNAMEGHFILGYGDAGDPPDKQIEMLPEASTEAEAFLKGHPETQNHFNRVVDLIEGFETPFGMELLSTVHWVATQEAAVSVNEALSKTYSWNERKRMFKEDQVRIAWDVLSSKGWFHQA